jgi:hypothetical protein
VRAATAIQRCMRVYDVQKGAWVSEEGDTPETIAKDTGFTLAEILKANDWQTTDFTLAPGATIFVPRTSRIRTFSPGSERVRPRTR